MTLGAVFFFASLGLSCSAQAESSFKKKLRAQELSAEFWEENRNCLSPELAKVVARQIFSGRKFNEWGKIREWPELKEAPAVIFDNQGDGRNVLIPEKTNWVVRKTNPPETGILALFHPLCSPSKRALNSLSSEKELKDAFFLAPASPSYEIKPWEQWKKAYPDWKMQVAYHENEWPEVKEWATPTFIFIFRGKIIHTVVGWPPEGNLESWKSGIEKLKIRKTQKNQNKRRNA